MAVLHSAGMSGGRTLGRILAWLGAVLLILLAVLAFFILPFDWNRARPCVNDRVSEALGRPFAIEGDIKVGWRHPVGERGWRSWVPWPRFSAHNITVANPDWTKQNHFAMLDEIDFQVKVLPLLTHDIVIPAINLVNPSVDLERLVDGRNNWTFKLKSSAGPSEWKLPVQADVNAAGLRIALVCTVTNPAHLAAVDLRLWLQGTSPDHLYQLTGIMLPETPPYATEGHVIGNFKPGASVFRLQFRDLAPNIGSDSNASKARIRGSS